MTMPMWAATPHGSPEPSDPAEDMAQRWVPSPGQLAVAAAMLAAAPAADVVLVGIALPGKARDIWMVGQEVRHASGFWLAVRSLEVGPLAYSTAREAADDAAGRHLYGMSGCSSYATINPDGTWAVFEGYFYAGKTA